MDTVKRCLEEKLKETGWDKVLTEETKQAYFKKLFLNATYYKSLSVVHFQLQEIMHYLTLENIEKMEIPVNPELAYVGKMYMETEFKDDIECHGRLQTPEETFGEDIETPPCRKCKDTNIAIIPIQKRSADEPTSYYYQCRKCNHRWKDT